MNYIEQIKFIEDNYPLYTNHISGRKIRHDFFKNIQTELQAYLLGFYAADGSINEKRKTLRIHLLELDLELVNLYKNIISPEARTFIIEEHKTTGRNGSIINAHRSYGVDIASSTLCKDLVDLGFGYNKSYKDLKLPNIPYNLIKDFIRGYFDGDGCITIWFSKEKGKSDRVRGKFDICAKSNSILLEILKFFSLNNINLNILYLKRDDMYRICTSSRKELIKIYNLLYKDSNFYLLRKFNKFNHYVNTEVTLLIAEYRNALEVNVNESNNPPKSVELDNDYIENLMR